MFRSAESPTRLPSCAGECRNAREDFAPYIDNVYESRFGMLIVAQVFFIQRLRRRGGRVVEGAPLLRE